MATLLSTIRTNVRIHLQETTAAFWTEAELLDWIIRGCQDLWRAILDLHQEHFLTVDATNVSLSASTATVTGVPADLLRVLALEPRDLSSTASSRDLVFIPKDYQHPDFRSARSLSAIDPTGGGIIFYAITGAGSPVAAPSIYVAPQISSAVNLRLVYIPTLAALTASSNNPIPGESDFALECFAVAHAKAKEREDQSPDPNWLADYATQKQSILAALNPRQEHEPQVVSGVFDALDAQHW